MAGGTRLIEGSESELDRAFEEKKLNLHQTIAAMVSAVPLTSSPFSTRRSITDQTYKNLVAALVEGIKTKTTFFLDELDSSMEYPDLFIHWLRAVSKHMGLKQRATDTYSFRSAWTALNTELNKSDIKLKSNRDEQLTGLLGECLFGTKKRRKPKECKRKMNEQITDGSLSLDLSKFTEELRRLISTEVKTVEPVASKAKAPEKERKNGEKQK